MDISELFDKAIQLGLKSEDAKKFVMEQKEIIQNV